MVKVTCFAFALAISSVAFCQETNHLTEKSDDASSLGLSALVGYNFNGKGDIKNLAPEIFLGWKEKIEIGSAKTKSLTLRVGADVSSTGKNKEITDYARSLMLPGNGGFNGVVSYLYEPKGYNNPGFNIVGNLAVGIKALSGFKDSTVNISQYNIRLSGGFQYKNLFSLIVQHTWGWHDLTSESEKTYKALFDEPNTNVRYLSVNVQSQLSEGVNLFITFRSLLSNFNLQDFDNKKIITIGLRKDVDFLSFVGPGSRIK